MCRAVCRKIKHSSFNVEIQVIVVVVVESPQAPEDDTQKR